MRGAWPDLKKVVFIAAPHTSIWDVLIGLLVIQAQRFRSQDRNREDARERLVHLIQSALEAPKPRLATKPTRASQRRRLEDKRAHATLKQQRQTKRIESDH